MNPLDGLIFAFGEEICKGIGSVFRFVFGPSNATVSERASHFVKSVAKIFITLFIIMSLAVLAVAIGRSK